MSEEVIRVHHSLLDRLIDLAHVSDDERRELRAQHAEATDQLDNPESDEDRQARIDAEREQKRAELQKQLDELNADNRPANPAPVQTESVV